MINFYITHPERKLSSVILRFSFMGTRYSVPCNESIPSAKWSKKKQRCKVNQGDVEAESINARLDKWEEATQKAISFFKDADYIPSADDMKARVMFERKGGSDAVARTAILDYIPQYIERYSSERSEGRIRHYKLLMSKIREFEAYTHRKYYFDDLDVDFYLTFKAWAFGVKEFSDNYFGALVSSLKTIAGEARDIEQLHNNNLKQFHVPREDVDAIYLPTSELLKIHDLEITPELVRNSPDYKTIDSEEHLAMKVEALCKAKDMFLLGAFTGLRYSDFSKLKEENFGEHITVVASKTGVKSVIPIHWVVNEILEKGYDFSRPMSEQKLNEHIKEVAKLAGMTEIVSLNKKVAGKSVTISEPKYKFVSTHTARRSFATNAYKAGIPTIAIMKVTGHKREATFMKYIKVTEVENADMLKDLDFFKK